ncbi:MAG: hypothetical protein ACI815_002294 [Psychroserpens sp.]|jgi:hypothetical protein
MVVGCSPLVNNQGVDKLRNCVDNEKNLEFDSPRFLESFLNVLISR